MTKTADTNPKKLDAVIAEELRAITARRNGLNLPLPNDDLVGVALSGGGIRSATICLGVLEILNKNCLLRKADYLSTVSGGGYTGAYVQAVMKRGNSTPEAFGHLFSQDDISRLKVYGDYLVPSCGGQKLYNWFVLVGAYFYSLVMNLVWVLALFVCLGLLFKALYDMITALTLPFCLGEIFFSKCTQLSGWTGYPLFLLCAAIAVFVWHFFLHGARNLPFRIWSSRILYIIEGGLLIAALPYVGNQIYSAYAASHGFFTRILQACPCTTWSGNLLADMLTSNKSCVPFFIFLGLLIVTGFFANPNILTLHRFYRDRLSAAFLRLKDDADYAFKLHTLNPGSSPENWGSAPYPLINTCLNLLGKSDNNFQGTKSCDYFLLSPLFCGSKLTDYAPTASSEFKKMTLPTAMAVSGAALNPNRGYATNRLLAFMMTLACVRLGYWAPHPQNIFQKFIWWPWYHVMELLSMTDTSRRRVSISDGGHIENLGIYELLRRRCRLIIAVDASADPDFGFDDLNNLIVRARNELGVTITFRERPESVIRPIPSAGYSQKHFVVADIGTLGGVKGYLQGYKGILVYLKSSMKQPLQWQVNLDEGYLYKTYHPAFPHEPTTDQFFDPPQWEAYYTLGKHMAEDMLSTVFGNKSTLDNKCTMTGKDWYAEFDSYVRSATNRE